MKEKREDIWVDEELRAYLRTKRTGPLAETDARVEAMRWRCVRGHVMPAQVPTSEGHDEFVRFCGVCGKPRREKPLDRDLKDMAIYRAACRVSFDGDFQMVADGRHRGLWPWSRQINAFDQDTDVGVLLEWDQVEELRDVLTRALRAREHPEKLIAACAAKDKEDHEEE